MAPAFPPAAAVAAAAAGAAPLPAEPPRIGLANTSVNPEATGAQALHPYGDENTPDDWREAVIGGVAAAVRPAVLASGAVAFCVHVAMTYAQRALLNSFAPILCVQGAGRPSLFQLSSARSYMRFYLCADDATTDDDAMPAVEPFVLCQVLFDATPFDVHHALVRAYWEAGALTPALSTAMVAAPRVKYDRRVQLTDVRVTCATLLPPAETA